MPNIQGAPLEEQVKILLEQNLAYSKEIYHISKKVKSYILWGRVMSSISIVVFIIVPIILGVFYWQPIVNSIMGKFLPASMLQSAGSESLLGGTGLDQQQLIQMINEQGGPLKAYQQLLDQNY